MAKITSYDRLPPFRDLFTPNFEDGRLYWKKPRTQKNKPGEEACYPRKCGKYTRWGIDLKEGSYSRANILYFLKYGIWPLEIDHINHDSADDRIKNIREISRSKNNWNRLYSDRTLPPHIYHGNKPHTYYGRIILYDKDYYIGSYSTIQEASLKIKQIEEKYYGKDLTIDYYLDVQQGSELWHFLRQNRITGTSAHSLLRTGSVEKTLEILKTQKSFNGNYWTERGKLLEPDARDIYTQLYNADMHEVGAVINSKFPQALWSPDGLIGLEGAIEIKCLAEKNHFEVHKNISPQYLAQIQFGLFISERKWCDLVNYNPDIDDPKQAFLVKRIYPIPEIQEKFYNIFRKELL